MKIFVDAEKHCHTTNPDGTLREVETDFFNGKCVAYIEGYCYDDTKGCIAIYPWKPYSELDSAQRAYEKQQITEYESALSEIETALGVGE